LGLLACVASGCGGGDAASTGLDGTGTTSSGTGEESTSTTTSATLTGADGSESSSGVDSTGSDDSASSSGGEPSCNDGIDNGAETDVDCGGGRCTGCQDGQMCQQDSDCLSLSCMGAICRPPACDDNIQNGDETDVDCGGSCDPCGDNQGCMGPQDCLSEVCAGGSCTPAGCTDGVLNGTETDLDCGGAVCPGCQEMQSCEEDEDCATLFCDNGMCGAVGCVNAADCSDLSGQCVVGSCSQVTHECEAVPAFEGAACNDGDNCTDAECNAGLCAVLGPVDCSFLDSGCSVGMCNPANGSCFEGALNDGDACEDSDLCTTGTTCGGGLCTGGTAVDCSFLDTGCQVGSCNPGNGLCSAQLAPNGSPCDDGFACSTNEECLAGACVPDNLVSMWSEDFSDNSAGWTLGTEWEIESAMAAACPTFGPDPGTDHTATADNGVAGVVVGGCAGTQLHDFYCLTSPTIDTSGANGPLMLDFWRHLHSDYTPFMQNKIDVYDGMAWQNVWASGGPPGIDDAAWTEIQHQLTAFKTPDFRVRFCFNITSGGVFTVASWNVDDVELRSCP
jgi:hypothetical protein